jgi:hypothetical protein
MSEAIGYFRSLRLFHWAIFAVVAISAFTVAFYQITNADCYGGTVLGRTCYRGYFTNTDDRGGTNVLPEIKNNQALPASDINDATSFYNLIHAAYTSGSSQKHTGAAFIYNTMMGKTAPGTGKSISDAEWAELFDRIKGLDDAGKIDWSGNVSVTINSYWQGTADGFSPDGTTDDDAYYANSKNESGITFRDYNNNIVYQILRRCANPVGEPSGLPQAKNYELTPNVSNNLPGNIEAGTAVTVQSSVNNTGETASDPTQWEITQINVKPGKKAPHEDEGATISGTAPCQSNGGAASGNYFDSADADCKNIAKGSRTFNVGNTTMPALTGVNVGDLPVGTRVCFALSVQPRSSTDDRWGHSKPICTVIGKKPKVQIWGGDIAVRGKIETSLSTKDIAGTSRTFGSWVEYGGFAVGTVNKFATGSGLANQTDSAQVAWSKLTFANKNQAGADSFGQYTTLANFRTAPTVSAFFNSIQSKTPIGAGTVDPASLAFNTGDPVQVRTAGNLTLTASTIPKGKSVVIMATGTVTIDGSIAYADDTLGSLRDIPQLVIIAANIDIKQAASRVDAWLVASGTINTCSDFAGNLTSGKCNALLELNGPVITNKLILNRTAGADTGVQSGDPAERFNLRPDAFLWARLQASGSNKAQTVYSVELPPRF